MKSIFVALSLLLIVSTIECTQRVTVGVYYETICPGCRSHFIQAIVPLKNQLGQYVNIDLVPFGNAHFYSNGPQCQHGQLECYGNAFQACSLDMNGFETAFKLVECMFRSAYFSNPEYSSKQCSQQLNLDYQQLDSCANGQKGLQLIREMANKTPNHQYVPWTTVQGRFVDGNVDLVDYICENYLNDVPACN
ncbi:antigen processing and presentation of exogenous peptide antigen via MHC class I [Dermatophagoides pteronyssinus]|uniref:Antigen processing and presentation of exogenous peptide antigen via MHC class I n=1 Tax=Dermatophagoides pteronyssinus TaxID=6956 RepID=A0ABQ8JUU2_DERPT|nr:antigen processing and presentation of exogenous peptide antigen via MHC class I [Dermatophagoides pteronyssinus]